MKLTDMLLCTMQTRLLPLVFCENRRQRDKWGIQEHDPYKWMAILSEEVGELAQAILMHEYSKAPEELVVKEAIQTATLALKVAEMFMARLPSYLLDAPASQRNVTILGGD